jgi:hypothetical protein
MKKFLGNAAVLFIFWVIVYWITVKIAVRFVTIDPINGIKPLFFSFWFFSILYGKYWSLKSTKTLTTWLKYSLVFFGFFTSVYYAYSVVKRSIILFNELIGQNYRGWNPNPHKPDDTLGLAPKRGFKGNHTFAIGPNIAMYFNKQGFRVPVKDSAQVVDKDTLGVMFLGCSYTYGDACLAEETFAFKVGRQLGVNTVNAGVCSYGLSQMYLLSQKLVPQYKPKYTVIQFSPWLVERATSWGAPAANNFLPSPYFYDKDDSIALQLPIERTSVFNINREELTKKYSGKYFSFLFGFALSYLFSEDWKVIKYKTPVWLGGPPNPSHEKEKVMKIAYSNMIREILKNGSRPVILCLGDSAYSEKAFAMFKNKNVIVVNADKALKKGIRIETGDAFTRYSKTYCHWRKPNPKASDSVMVDSHPNPYAHSIIANEIVNAIKSNQK